MENIINDSVIEYSKSHYSNVYLDQSKSEKIDLDVEQVPCTLIDDLSSTQSSKVDRVEDISPNHVASKLISVSDINTYPREAFNYLHFDTFYSLYPNLFDGLDQKKFIQ